MSCDADTIITSTGRRFDVSYSDGRVRPLPTGNLPAGDGLTTGNIWRHRHDGIPREWLLAGVCGQEWVEVIDEVCRRTGRRP